MKKTTLSWAIIGALGLVGCGGGGGDSGGGTTPPEPQPRALPVAGVYLPVLMDAQGQLINRPVNDSYRAVGLVYPASTEGTGWAMNIAEKRSATVSTYTFPQGFSSLNKGEGYPLTLSLLVNKSQPSTFDSAEQKSNTNVDGLVKVASVPDTAGSSQSLWVLDYRPVKAKIDSALTIQNWGGQVALQPMVTAPINADSWYNLGESALFQDFKTERSNNGSGVKLTIQFIEGCTVSGETEANTPGLNKLTLTGWKECSFNTLTGPADIKDGKIYEGLWETKMRDFANRNASVTAYLAMKPGNSNGQKDTLMIGIPEITGITPFLLEVQPL
ncbi:hypothetical protein ACTG2W_02935 [Aeromonas sp. 96A]|uniref:hypothetical protein n=1 Tax=Aeromonas TaxID=642 RepID=UPI0007B5D213|nr:hypothetical protein [Aeromonas veronii]ANB69609.1 hypothetical protein A6033_14490 [Aeromonas veronii]MCJ8234226.1 hypothetical protein [Aeromonas veronii]PSJ89104.1 hypothetical protein CT153_09565 [Aeromonas veronii]